MAKLKKFFLSFKNTSRFLLRRVLKLWRLGAKRPILASGLVLMFAGLIYFLITFFSVSRERLELARLGREMRESGPCHESCILRRRQMIENIASKLKESKKIRAEVESYFLAQDEISNAEFKRQLLEIMLIAYGPGNPPDFLITYLTQESGDPSLKADIIRLFLAPTNEAFLFEYYFTLLQNGADEKIKESAIAAIGSISDKESVFKIEQLDWFKEFILNTQMTLSLRTDALFLLSEYHDFFPRETYETLSSIYASTQEVIIKYLAADILGNTLGYFEFEKPEVPEAEWNNYWNN